mmetsp:Transcript_8974/g.22116  ORF Transcript_8974/g.22116 Transcript_8974/m.22116 type:complete len:110 (+) Transcript_8974:182-511(+)
MDLDIGAMATTRGALLSAEWFASLVMFSTMASASKHNDSARQYVVAIGVIMWLITSALAVCYLMGYSSQLPMIHLDHQGPVLQVGENARPSFLSLATFSTRRQTGEASQ